MICSPLLPLAINENLMTHPMSEPWLAWRPMSEEPRTFEIVLYRNEDDRVWTGNHPPGCAIGDWSANDGSGESSYYQNPILWARIPGTASEVTISHTNETEMPIRRLSPTLGWIDPPPNDPIDTGVTAFMTTPETKIRLGMLLLTEWKKGSSPETIVNAFLAELVRDIPPRQ